MPDHGATLSDVMARVPHLLQSCIPSHSRRCCGMAVRDLRLVCKELNVSALQAVTHVEVELGEGACHEPGQVVRLMQYSHLKHLTVIIVTTSARTGPSLAQQQASCTFQMQELLQGMATAIKGVTDLTLIVRHDLIRSSRTLETHAHTKAPLTCPASFSVITRTVYTMLAASLPALQALSVQGCCRDAAFDAFGASCPLITHLQVEAITLRIQALKDTHLHFPNLTSFELSSPAVCPDDVTLSKYVGACLHKLQPCTALKTMILAFKGRPWVECKPGRWAHVPASLREFKSESAIYSLEDAPELLSLLHTLTIKNHYCLDMLKILSKTTTRLQHFGINSMSDTVMLKGYVHNVAQGVTQIRERVLAGLDLVIPRFGLDGFGSSIQSTLAGLPVLPSVKYCKLDFLGLSQPHVLAQLSRVFPNLEELCMEGDSVWLDNPEMGLQVLQPLTACKSLVALKMHMKLALLATGLASLLQDLPDLWLLSCKEGVGMDHQHLRMCLAAEGRDLQVLRYRGY